MSEENLNQNNDKSKTIIEQFKIIKDFPDYQISNLGRVKSYKRGGEKFLRTFSDKGYLNVNLYESKKQKKRPIHLLVWEAFGKGRRNGRELQVDHIDENKLNNRIDNLQLLTPRSNTSKWYQSIKKNGLPTGVCWNKNRKKYTVHIWVNKKLIHLGYFLNIQEASNIYKRKLEVINGK